jgi:hypothetical protein
MATEGTKLQVNFKLADGTLINIYAATQAELADQLTALQDSASLITATATALGGSNAAAYITQAFNATPVASSAPVAEGHCKHGALVWRESKPGAPKAWKGWFCPSPKGTPDQCEPKFVR